MKYLDEKTLKNSINTTEEFSNMISLMKDEVDAFVSAFSDLPSKISGWGHNYFCSECGGLLIFDYNKPTDHICSSCSKNNQSELLNQVWVTNYRNLAITTAWKSALIFKATNEAKYLDNVKTIIGFYSDNYLDFRLHNKEALEFDSLETMKWGCGRIMPQGLNECIIIIRMLNALEAVKEEVGKDFLDSFYNNFVLNAFELIKPQVQKVHNISCWYNSAVGAMGLMFNNKEMIDFAFIGEWNIRKQLNEGVTKDSFWYEGSIHYNFFTLEGMTNLLMFTKLYDYDFGKEKDILESMLINAYNYAFDSHQLPNPNDGWPNVNLKTYSYIYTVATKVFGEDSVIGNLLKNIENKEIVRGTLPLSRPYYYENRIPLERLALLPELDLNNYKEVKADSINFETSNYGLIKNDRINVFLKYGHRGPSHAHPDKMNIEVTIDGDSLSRDLSNSGYGAILCNEWNRVSSSHSTVICNGVNQISMDQGNVLEFNENKIIAEVKDVYSIADKVDIKGMKESLNPDEVIKYLNRYLNMSTEEAEEAINSNKDVSEIVLDVLSKQSKIDYKRTIELFDNGFEDIFEVTADKENTIDYMFHSEAKLVSSVDCVESTLGFNSHGYQHIKNVKKVNSVSNIVKLEWELGKNKLVTTIEIDGMELFLADTYDNPATKLRKTFILRSKSNNAKFVIKWNVK